MQRHLRRSRAVSAFENDQGIRCRGAQALLHGWREGVLALGRDTRGDPGSHGLERAEGQHPGGEAIHAGMGHHHDPLALERGEESAALRQRGFSSGPARVLDVSEQHGQRV
ncbi:hypothetical protein [Myxococcus sp. Y35]|uniref:hypothetical protein n=1 Tax=Pseudomyxococcus flavus TaxID=3115648 RepID=UPI003CF98156